MSYPQQTPSLQAAISLQAPSTAVTPASASSQQQHRPPFVRSSSTDSINSAASSLQQQHTPMSIVMTPHHSTTSPHHQQSSGYYQQPQQQSSYPLHMSSSMPLTPHSMMMTPTSMLPTPTSHSNLVTPSSAAAAATPSSAGSASLPPTLARKRSNKPRAPTGSNPKKAKLEDSAGGGAVVTNQAQSMQQPPFQRAVSNRRPPAGSAAAASQDYFSSSSLPLSASTSTTRVICIVPGSDTLKIGFSDALKPSCVRQLVAYKMTIPQAMTTMPMDQTNENGAVEKKEEVREDEEMKDVSVLPSTSAAPSSSSTRSFLSDLDTASALALSDEECLTESDRSLLFKWRKKREADVESAVRLLSGVAPMGVGARKKKTAGVEEVPPPSKLLPIEGSIHDTKYAEIEITASTSSIAAPSSAVLPASSILASSPLPIASRYSPLEPFSRASGGGFNLSPTTPIQRIKSCVEEIVRHACETELEIKSSAFGTYGVALVIPDAWHVQEISAYIDVLLTRLGFKQLFLLRESSAAAFGAGLATSCVVDLGASHTTVTCMEDGQIIGKSVIALNYGGRDVDEVLRSSIPDKAYWNAREQLLVDAEKIGPDRENLIEQRMKQQLRLWKEKYAYAVTNAPVLPLVPTLPVLSHRSHGRTIIASSVPAELQYPAAIAPLAYFHPSLFLSSLHLSAAMYRFKTLESIRLRADPHVDVLASSVYAVTEQRCAEVRLDTNVMLEDEITLGAVGSSSAPPVMKRGKSLHESPIKVAPISSLQQTSPSSAAVVGSSIAPASSSSTSATHFRIDRRRKDHQQLLLQYTEEQLLAGDHLATVHALEEVNRIKREEARDILSAATGATPNDSLVESFLASRQALHEAIVHSIRSACSTTTNVTTTSLVSLTPNVPPPTTTTTVSINHDLQNRLLSSILLTGGMTALPQICEALEERLNEIIPMQLQRPPSSLPVHCILHPRGLDSAQLSWRGAAILSQAQTTKDLWITADEWQRNGAKLLREKAHFYVDR